MDLSTENKMKNSKLTYIIYTIIVILLFGCLIALGHLSKFQEFITKIEQNSFDLRQNLIVKYKTPNKDIIILAVDDATYEYIMDKYGSWPISRQIWSDVTNSIEKANPKYIIFDMLFVKPNLFDKEADKNFINTIKNNKNIYLSMNFDNYSDEIRKSKNLDDKLKLNIKQGNLKDNPYITFSNCRTIMDELIQATKNIGIINVTRDNDGIIRNTTPVFKYKKNYYPNLSLAVAMDILKQNSISFINNKIILDKNHIIPLDSTQRAILNWYGKNATFKHIPFWQAIKANKENNTEYFKNTFENKIIYIGTTATSLSDIKSVPTESNLAGVELHATFLNNILDNDFIKKVPAKIDFVISVLLSFFVGYIVLKTSSVPKTIAFLIATLILYAVTSTYIMAKWNIWISVVIPYISIIATFILIYCEKYLMKSKDYEQTYKLAVTDGLTQLYNHRYFQEQMINQVNNFERYGNVFSLILIDIDFFKKFNDTYGHQSGDCVLKQVANILKKNSRTSDIACRYGGEEMAIILTNTNKEEAIITAEKICTAVRNNKFILTNNEKVNVTISVGVATIKQNGTKPQEIIEYSDKCLYKAKESGRNQVVHEI